MGGVGIGMRKRRLSLNIMSSLCQEVIQIASALILPRFIISTFGSGVNGLVNSLGQFLSVISLLECGIAAVIRSALYKPLADGNRVKINEIMSSASGFYRKIAMILFAYVGVLVILYPGMVSSGFGRLYVSAMIIILSLNSFSEYFFGCLDALLLASDQRGYVSAISNAICIVLNTLASVLLIELGAGIHVVKLASVGLLVFRAVLVHCFVKREYRIDYHAPYEAEPIPQKWNGIAQHIANYVLENADVIILTMFSSIEYVSVYSVYFLVIRAIKQVFSSISGGFQPLFGEYFAKRDFARMKRAFDCMEWICGTFSTIAYGCAAFLIVPFVRVYTSNISDVNYDQPQFALIMVAAYWIYSNNTPYHCAILAAGRYRETQRYFAIAAIINVATSVAMVNRLGFIGVAIGTLAAMLFQTTWMIIYNARHITKRPAGLILKQMVADAIVILVSSIISSGVRVAGASWISWIVMAVKIFVIWAAASILVNAIFYRGANRGGLRDAH